jgi:hypothetical protein
MESDEEPFGMFFSMNRVKKELEKGQRIKAFITYVRQLPTRPTISALRLEEINAVSSSYSSSWKTSSIVIPKTREIRYASSREGT